MKIRRIAYIVLSILMIVITFLFWWMLVKVDQVVTKIACSTPFGRESRCETDTRYTSPLLTFVIFFVGSFLALGFALMAWSDTVTTTQPPDSQIMVLESTGMLVVRTSGPDDLIPTLPED
ncbi:MAG: hypothetical protein GYB65_14370 [Chloroflexi bacterium]|nr:hypothetical protein [Chloroflexota bacterium]